MKRVTSDLFILECITNCELEFDYTSTPACNPSSLHPEYKFALVEQQAIDGEIDTFLQKQVIKKSQPETGEIISPILLMPIRKNLGFTDLF